MILLLLLIFLLLLLLLLLLILLIIIILPLIIFLVVHLICFFVIVFVVFFFLLYYSSLLYQCMSLFLPPFLCLSLSLSLFPLSINIPSVSLPLVFCGGYAFAWYMVDVPIKAC